MARLTEQWVIQRLQRELVECQNLLAAERLRHVQQPMEMLAMHVPTIQELESTGARRDADPNVSLRAPVPGITTTFVVQPTGSLNMVELVFTTTKVAIVQGMTTTTTHVVNCPINLAADEVLDDAVDDDLETASSTDDQTDTDDEVMTNADFIALAWA